jgi:chromate transporter
VLKLAWMFLRIGALAFGGLGATLALIEDELTRRRALLSRDAMAEALTYTKFLPGSTVVQVVAYLACRLGGWTTAAVCTAAFLLPSVAVMLVLAYSYGQIAEVPAIAAVRRGLLAAVVGLLILTTYRLAQPLLTGVVPVLVALGAFAITAITQANAAWIVLAAGAVGVLMRR